MRADASARLLFRRCAEGVAIVVEQGHLGGRPSRIEVRVRGDQVKVLGSAVVVARGQLRVG